MSRTIHALRPEKTISKSMITLWTTAIIVISIIGFWASEVRGSLYYGSVENFPYLLVPACLLGLSFTLTAVFIFVTEEKFAAYDTWCMLLMLWTGISFGTWFIPLGTRMLGIEFVQIVLVGFCMSLLFLTFILLKLAWTYKFWVLGTACLIYFFYKTTPRITKYWKVRQSRGRNIQAIASSDNVTTLPRQ